MLFIEINRSGLVKRILPQWMNQIRQKVERKNSAIRLGPEINFDAINL